jgi:hypothetical protein
MPKSPTNPSKNDARFGGAVTTESRISLAPELLREITEPVTASLKTLPSGLRDTALLLQYSLTIG